MQQLVINKTIQGFLRSDAQCTPKIRTVIKHK